MEHYFRKVASPAYLEIFYINDRIQEIKYVYICD